MNQKSKKYLTPKELHKIPIVAKRFKNISDIGYFVRNFDDKIDSYRTARSRMINRELFIRLLEHCETFK